MPKHEEGGASYSRVDGLNSTWTSSTDSPQKLEDQPSSQPATMTAGSNQPANPAQDAATLASRPRRGQGSAAASGGSAQWGGSSSSGPQIPPSLHQHNTIQQHMHQQQVNQIDPVQLEQSLEFTGKRKGRGELSTATPTRTARG